MVPRRGAKLLRIALENAKMYDFTRRVCSNLVSEDLSLLAVPILDANKARELLLQLRLTKEDEKEEDDVEETTTTKEEEGKKKKKKRDLWSVAEAARHADVREDLVLKESTARNSK